MQTTHLIDLDIFLEEIVESEYSSAPPKTEEAYNNQRKLINQLIKDDPVDYLNRKLTYIYNRFKTCIVFVLDNIDQHAYISPSPAIFTLNQLAELKVNCIVTLRDTTHRIGMSSELSSAYAKVKTYVLSQAQIPNLGRKRLIAARQIANNVLQNDENAITKVLDHIIEYDREYKIDTHIQRLESSQPRVEVNSYDYGYIWLWVNSLGNGDLREVLHILLNSLESNHLTSEEFTRQKASSVELFNVHSDVNIKRLKMALVCGRHRYFSEERNETRVLNLFDHGTFLDPYHYIFRLKILQLFGNLRHFKIKQIYKVLESKFHNIDGIKDHARRVITAFVINHLVAIENPLKDGRFYPIAGKSFDIKEHEDSECFITPNGLFHLNVLIYDDIYLDEMKYATDHYGDIYNTIFAFSQQVGNGRKLSTARFIDIIIEHEIKYKALSDYLEVSMIGNDIKRAYDDKKTKEDDYWPEREK